MSIIPKQRIYEILLTAVISAGIAFLQSLLAHIGTPAQVTVDPLTAGLTGAIIHGARNYPLA